MSVAGQHEVLKELTAIEQEIARLQAAPHIHRPAIFKLKLKSLTRRRDELDAKFKREV